MIGHSPGSRPYNVPPSVSISLKDGDDRRSRMRTDSLDSLGEEVDTESSSDSAVDDGDK